MSFGDLDLRDDVVPKMLNDGVNTFIASHHLLVMAPTLLMGSTSDRFAHHPINLPLSGIFSSLLYYILEFDQEIYVSLSLLGVPLRASKGFLGLTGKRKLSFRVVNPRFDFIQRNIWFLHILRGLAQLILRAHHSFNWEIYIKQLLSNQKIPFFSRFSHQFSIDSTAAAKMTPKPPQISIFVSQAIRLIFDNKNYQDWLGRLWTLF